MVIADDASLEPLFTSLFAIFFYFPFSCVLYLLAIVIDKSNKVAPKRRRL